MKHKYRNIVFTRRLLGAIYALKQQENQALSVIGGLAVGAAMGAEIILQRTDI